MPGANPGPTICQHKLYTTKLRGKIISFVQIKKPTNIYKLIIIVFQDLCNASSLIKQYSRKTKGESTNAVVIFFSAWLNVGDSHNPT